MSLPPLAQDLPPEAQRIEALARRIATPCEAGTIAWHVWGDDSAPPMVLLHGGSGSWAHWVRNVLPLAEAGWRVIVPDLPGFGDSAAPPQVRDADGMAAPVREGLRQIVGDTPATFVAFSFGSLVASLLAQAHPEAVARLVIIGAPGLGLRDARLKLYDWRHLPTQEERDAVHRRNLGILMLGEAAIDETAVRIQAANLPRDRMRRRRLALTDILARTLPELQCRVDAIYGDNDALYRDLLPELKAAFARFPTVRQLVFIPGGAHWIQYENPEQFQHVLQTLLAS